MGRKRKPEDFKAELESHLQLEADRLRSEGSPDPENAARRALGNRTLAEERFYESGRSMPLQHLLRDLRFAARVLRKEPKFSALVILGLALGIAVSTSLFAFVSSSTRPRGTGIHPDENVVHPESYVSITLNANSGTEFSAAEFRYLQDHAASVSGLAAESEPGSFVLATPAASAEPEQVLVRFESADFLAVRGFHTALGRTFSNAEEREPVAVLSYSFWQRRFGGDSSAVGQTLSLNSHPITIIGIASPSFHPGDNADIFLPLDLQPLAPANLAVMLNARLQPGASLPHAQAEIQSLSASFDQANPSLTISRNPHEGAPQVSVFLGDAPPNLRRQRNELIFGLDLAIAMILLIACSNLASLLLARASVRRRELGVRLSLGASRARLISQLLTESLLLAISGGLLGVLLSTWLSKWLLASLPFLDPHPDPRVLLYGLLLSLVTGISFGLGPALAATRTNLSQALHSGGSAATEAAAFKVGSRRNLLVVAPLALSLMLLIGATLLIRTAESRGFIQTSFDSSHLIGLGFRLEDQGYDSARAGHFREQLRDRFRTLPGVASVAFTDHSFLLGGSCQIRAPQPTSGFTNCHRVSPDFFKTVGLRILRGRPFNSSDRSGSAPVAVVSQSFAEKFFPSQEPLGNTAQNASGVLFDIIGVAADVTDISGPIPTFPTVYLPDTQETSPSPSLAAIPRRELDRMEILVRASANPSSVMAELRQVVRAADPSVWLTLQTFDDYLSRFTNNARVAIFVFGILGALVLLMAAAGIYALLAYSVSRRTREIGIRMALGARNREILLLVLRRTLILITWGIAAGLLGALALGRILTALIFKTPPPDAFTSIAVAAALAATSLLASYLPARKALRVNPVETLRCD